MVDTRHDVLRAEGHLLGLGEEIVDIRIERERADDLDGHLLLGNYLGRIEHVEFELFGEFLVEHLDAQVPLREIPGLDGIPHVAAMEIGIHAVHFQRLVPDHRLHAELRLPVEFHEMRFALGIHEAESVHAEAFHEAEGARNRAVGHDPHDHVHRFRAEADEIPEVVVRGLRLGEAAVGRGLRGVDQVGKLDRVLDEEHRDVIADQVPVALRRVELRGETAHVAGEIGRTLVAGHGGEAGEGGRLDADLVEDRGARILRNGLLQFEVAMHAIAPGMHHAFRNALVIEVKYLLARDMVRQQLRAARTGGEPVLVVCNRMTLRGGHHVVVAFRLLMVCATFRQFEFVGHAGFLYRGWVLLLRTRQTPVP